MSTQTALTDIEAERAVLGAMLVSEPAVDRVLVEVGLKVNDFYLDRHRVIYQAMRKLNQAGSGVDPLTVNDALSASGHLEKAGGKNVVYELSATVAAPGNAKNHAEIVRGLGHRRKVVLTGQKIVESALAGPANGEITALASQLATLSDDSGPDPFQIRTADLSRVKPTRWLWKHRVPVGYVSLLVGAEGVGKGTLTAWMIAQITRGTLPGDGHGTPGRVLIAGDEDAFDDVWTARLHAVGADLDLVDVLDEDDDLLDVGRDSHKLGKLIRKHGYRLLFIDHLLDVLGRHVDDYKAKSVRDAIRPLRLMVREHEIAALGSLHPNKGRKGSFRDLVSGSHAFNAISRSSLYLAPHPDDENRRILVRPKGNLSVEPPGFEFKIDGRELEINGHRLSQPAVTGGSEGKLGYQDVLTPPSVTDSLAEEVDAAGTGEVQGRADIARQVGRDPADGGVGRALEKLNAENRWEKLGRGKWQKIANCQPHKAVANGNSEEAEVFEFPETAK